MQAIDGYESLPSGSRLAKYLGGAASSVSASAATTSAMSTMAVNVPSFVPQFAQMNLRAENGIDRQSSYQNLHEPVNDFIQQENHGGTMYFYQPGVAATGRAESTPGLGSPNHQPPPLIPPDAPPIVATGGCFTYQGPLPHVGKFRPKSGPAAHFMSPDLKTELVNRQLAMKARPDPAAYPDMPQAVEHLRDIVPLEAASGAKVAHQQTVYKATSLRDGLPYCIRRVHGVRLATPKAMMAVETWKKLNIVHVVQLREVIATRGFGDNSLLFIYDYHPLAETLKSRHFGRSSSGVMIEGMTGAKLSSPHNGPSPTLGASGGVPELQLWSYVVQLTAALRSIHASGISARCLDVSKIIVHGKNKVMLAVCGLLDVTSPEHQQIQVQQGEDLLGLGRVLLALATGNVAAARRDVVQHSLAYIGQHYSSDMKNIIGYLLSAGPTAPRKTISEVMPMIGARFYHHIECLQMRSDILENELSREVENGRLFRLLCKLNTIVERPEHNMDASWSETGDRFLVKLFRDYIFHQVTESGKPWMDMAHIVQCLNKLDAGVSERIELVSRDGDNVIIVSYADLRRCIEAAFRELTTATVLPPGHR